MHVEGGVLLGRWDAVCHDLEMTAGPYQSPLLQISVSRPAEMRVTLQLQSRYNKAILCAKLCAARYTQNLTI